MSAEPQVSVPKVRRRARRSLAERLRDAIDLLAGGHARFLTHTEKNWASITFAGTRHTLQLCFEGSEAIEAGEELIDALPDHEFALHGQLVADAQVVAVDHRLSPEPRLLVSCEMLLLEDA